MGVLNFSGSLPVAVLLHWKSDVIQYALTNLIPDQQTRYRYQDHEYVIANERVTSFSIVANDPTTGQPIVTIDRQVVAGQRFFDDKVGTYTTSPVPAEALERLMALGATARCTMSMTFTFHAFFHHLVMQMTRVDASPDNLAAPSDFVSKAILASFTHTVAAGKIRIDYKDQTILASNIPCKLSGQKVDRNPNDPSGAPSVKLTFDLDLMPSNTPKRDLMLQLIATDWSQLADLKRNLDTTPRPAKAVPWYHNVRAYLCNHTNMQRGERLRADIMIRHKDKEPAVLVPDLRDDIDRYLITANHWGQQREDPNKERYQFLLSDLFGTLHQEAWDGSPVAYLRDFTWGGDVSYDWRQLGALTLQYGTGHCREHANVSYSIMGDILANPNAKVKIAVFSGNANIDHAFVIVDLLPTAIVKTKSTNPDNSRLKPREKKTTGIEISVWNLKEAIAQSSRAGFVLDPYLDVSVVKPEAAKLLDSITKKGAGLNTEFVAFLFITPTPNPAIPAPDYTTRSEDERKRLVPNV